MNSKYRSPEIHLLMASLAKAQGLYKPLVPNEDTAGGKFANLHAILLAVKDALSTNGISFYQYIELLDEGSGASLLWTQLAHESGQYISSCSRVVAGNTFRETFNSLESYKRLNALLLLGIAPIGRDPLIYDDHGASQADRFAVKSYRSQSAPQRSVAPETVTTEEYEDLMWELNEFPEVVASICKYYNITTVADLPRSEFYNAKSQIRKIKKTHEEYLKDK